MMLSVRFLTSILILITGDFQSNIGFYGVSADVNEPVNGAKYLGCYKDKKSRDLERRFADKLTIRECFNAVADAGLKYAGLQYTNQCFGGNTVGKYGESPGECTWQCSGTDSDQHICGGRWKQSVFIMEDYIPTGVCTGPVARWSGDPHFTTFDNLKYDCQGAGEFTILKDLGSQFEVRGRFQYLNNERSGVTVTRGVAFNTGRAGEPTISLTLPDTIGQGETCAVTMYVNGAERQTIGSVEGVAEIFTNGDKTYISTSNGASLSIFARNAGSRFGCYFSVSVCIPDGDNQDGIVGLLGTPNGNMLDDWMNSTGTVITPPVGERSELLFQTAYDYCVGNWCVTNENDSMFTYDEEIGTSFDEYNNCPVGFDSTTQDLYNAADAKIKQDCNDDPKCIIESVEGGEEAARILAEAEHGLDELDNDPVDTITRTSTESPTVSLPTTIAPSTPSTPSPSPTESPIIGAFGDPHIKTWTGESYDFHGICDLVLFSNPSFDNGNGLDVYIRNKQMKMWSFIETAVIRIGKDKFELTGGKDIDSFLINGIVQKVNNENGVVGNISGYNIKFIQVNDKSRKFVINLDTNNNNKKLEEIVFTTWYSFVSVTVKNPTNDHFNGSLGLMGSYPAGVMVARDGNTVFDDSNEFGKEWQVLSSEPQLFAERGTVGPNDMCSSPSNVEMRRRLEGSAVTLKEAEIACGSVHREMKDLCIFDVLATHDKSSSGAY